MRSLLYATALGLLLLAAPAADASCHFCLDDVRTSCTGGDIELDTCRAAVSYASEHLHEHAMDVACRALADQALNCP